MAKVVDFIIDRLPNLLHLPSFQRDAGIGVPSLVLSGWTAESKLHEQPLSVRSIDCRCLGPWQTSENFFSLLCRVITSVPHEYPAGAGLPRAASRQGGLRGVQSNVGTRAASDCT